MTIDTNTMISITEANQNFSKVARVVDEHGTAVILKNNVPRYLVIDFSKAEQEKMASTEDVLAISERLIKLIVDIRSKTMDIVCGMKCKILEWD